jgi:hypothetical protein
MKNTQARVSKFLQLAIFRHFTASSARASPYSKRRNELSNSAWQSHYWPCSTFLLIAAQLLK